MSINNKSQQIEDIGPSADMAEEASEQQTEKIGPNADMSQATNDEEPGFVFDETKTHYPVFYLADIPYGYFTEMVDAAIVHAATPWVAISSNSPTNVIQEIKANVAAGGSPAMPFLNSTVEEVYEFFKNHVRSADDDPRGYFHTFSYFTFLVVDADCIKSEPWQCILCCDAPDYGESHPETRLKQLRLPIARAMEGINLLEGLFQTPSEFVGTPDFVLGMVPPSWEVEVHNDQGERTGFRVDASPGDARAKKGHSIWKLEQEAKQQRAEKAAGRGKL